MTSFIQTLQVDGFRALKHLRIEGLGKVNLITGKNNSGKSSLLEAVRILASGGALRTFSDIMTYREEMGAAADAERTYLKTEIAPFCNLFNGFPALSPNHIAFTIAATGSLPPSVSKISASINWFTRKSDPERGSVSYEPAAGDMFDDVESFPGLNLDIAGRKRIVPLDRLSRVSQMRLDADVAPVPCVYLEPFSSRSTIQLSALWDAVVLTDTELEIVKALRIISADIQGVSMIGSDERRNRPRTAIARSSRYPNPVPLRTFGDGVNRLFGLILSLCNARNGVLLVDEIDNGLHYSVQGDIWRTIFRLAEKLNVQVFATSHSSDCVRAFEEAAHDSPEAGALVRLTEKNGTIIPTVFTEQELAIVARDQIEVR